MEHLSNPNLWMGQGILLPWQYQVGEGVQITINTIYGTEVTGTLIAVDQAGLPLAIISERKIYRRYLMTEFFYCN